MPSPTGIAKGSTACALFKLIYYSQHTYLGVPFWQDLASLIPLCNTSCGIDQPAGSCMHETSHPNACTPRAAPMPICISASAMPTKAMKVTNVITARSRGPKPNEAMALKDHGHSIAWAKIFPTESWWFTNFTKQKSDLLCLCKTYIFRGHRQGHLLSISICNCNIQFLFLAMKRNTKLLWNRHKLNSVISVLYFFELHLDLRQVSSDGI